MTRQPIIGNCQSSVQVVFTASRGLSSAKMIIIVYIPLFQTAELTFMGC